jgi:hypothetical protein
MWKFGKVLSSVWSIKNCVCYASGLTAEGVGQWYDMAIQHLGDCYGIESDLVRMDCTVCIEALRFERAVYESCGLTGDSLLAVQLQEKTRGIGRHGTYYTVSATRKSGDPNTSCGNSMMTGYVLLSMFHRLNIPTNCWRAIILGDDVVLLVRRSRRFSVEEVRIEFALAGMEAEPILREDPIDLTFCSQRFWPTGDGTVLGPKVGRFLSKFAWTLADTRGDRLLQLARGNALGLYNSCRHVPVVGEFLERILQLTDSVVVNPVYQWRKHAERVHQRDAMTWAAFVHWYGQPDMQFIVEQLNNITSLPTTVLVPGLDRWLEADA